MIAGQDFARQPEMPFSRQSEEAAAPSNRHTYDDDEDSMLTAALEVCIHPHKGSNTLGWKYSKGFKASAAMFWLTIESCLGTLHQANRL